LPERRTTISCAFSPEFFPRLVIAPSITSTLSRSLSDNVLQSKSGVASGNFLYDLASFARPNVARLCLRQTRRAMSATISSFEPSRGREFDYGTSCKSSNSAGFSKPIDQPRSISADLKGRARPGGTIVAAFEAAAIASPRGSQSFAGATVSFCMRQVYDPAPARFRRSG